MTSRRRRRQPGERRIRNREPSSVFTLADVEFIDRILAPSHIERDLEPDQQMTAIMFGRRPPAEVTLSPWGRAIASVIAAVVDGDHRLFPASLRAWALSATCVEQMRRAATRAKRRSGNRAFLVRFGPRYIVQGTPDAGALFGTPFAADVTDVALRLREDLDRALRPVSRSS